MNRWPSRQDTGPKPADTGRQGYEHKRLEGAVFNTGEGEKYDSAAVVKSFENFTETVPGTTAAIRMIAVPGGEFTMGSSTKEAFHKADEGPQKKVKVSPFFMGEVEVTWNQFWAFYNETMSEGRTPPEKIYANNNRPDVDAVSGPTPPFGFPDQGWGMGERPAITMTHYSASTFCQWLSLKTGRHYRLPTEAEWEYAARGGTETPYFFEGNPKKYSEDGFWSKFKGADTTTIASYVVYSGNSTGKTQDGRFVKANPFGLKNMLGNVMEYCSDWYADDAYSKITCLIEDVAFHIEDLPQATEDLSALLDRHGYEDSCIYGHALEGNFHFIINQAFDSESEVRRYEEMIRDVASMVVGKYDGSLKAEHGTGRNMAPFVEYEWGKDAFRVMKRIKDIFDPKGLLNPGVIFNDDPSCFLKDFKPLPILPYGEKINKCIEWEEHTFPAPVKVLQHDEARSPRRYPRGECVQGRPDRRRRRKARFGRTSEGRHFHASGQGRV